MRFLIVDTYYPAFLNRMYSQNPELAEQSYRDQWALLMSKCFGVSDSYSSSLIALNHEAQEVVVNCEPLQKAWALENGLRVDTNRYRLDMRRWRGLSIPFPSPDRRWLIKVLAAQIEDYKPDVLYVQDLFFPDNMFLRNAKNMVRLVVGQISSLLPENKDFRLYDLILTSFPHYVNLFRARSIQCEYFRLGFGASVLKRLEQEALFSEFDAVFVGGYAGVHCEGTKRLEKIAAQAPVDFWGYGVDALSSDSHIRRRYHGEAWGFEMYRVLRQAKIALNRHITSVSEQYANNMRLYEATGVGTLLLTDWKENLPDLFEPGKEVAVYHSPEECIMLIKYYLVHDEERQAIARAGQQRTLSEHTYYHRMQELVDLIQPLMV